MLKTRVITIKTLASIPFDDLVVKTEEAIKEASAKLSSEHDNPFTEVDKKKLRIQTYSKTCQQFAEAYSLDAHVNWLPAQLIAHFNKWTLKRNKSGKYDALATVRYNLGSSSDWERGVYMFTLYVPRAKIVSRQVAKAEYSALVPYILSSFKKYHNVAYNEWDLNGIEHILEPWLAEVVGLDVSKITKEDILEAIEVGLTVKSGPRTGTSRSPETTAFLYGIGHLPVGSLPWLGQIMLSQIWCAHPTNRTQYMILDPNDLDKVPDPIISQPIFFKPKNTFPQDLGANILHEKMPWE
ncbi:hypothetical protein UFOVP273_117 [uncultured Caudovirales phage]|uniref:Uncharacterized protein n=1 Tax=uncultured Caudovirales phage TaxID=2100421 RepID=A0A6J5LIQ6_9CAUD|nr:hypothetical protein UFOVP273_117 [uncultured Caudovirales phage]